MAIIRKNNTKMIYKSGKQVVLQLETFKKPTSRINPTKR